MTTFEIENGIPIPDTNKGGRPRNNVLAALVERAAKDVSSGKYRGERDAAKAYMSEYTNGSITAKDGEIYLHKLNDLTKYIKRKVIELTQQ